MDACITLLAQEGSGALSVRRVATEADANVALVSYHFGGMKGLVRQAYSRATRQLIDRYVAELDAAQSIEDLYAVGLRLSEESKDDGSAAVLASALAAAFHDAEHAAAIAESLGMWRDAVRSAVERVFAEKGLADAVDVEAVAGAVSASMIGMVTMDALEPRPFGQTLGALGPFVRLVDRTIRLVPGPIARRILRCA